MVPCSSINLEKWQSLNQRFPGISLTGGALPTPGGVQQADCLLTPVQARELTIDTMASWALDWLYPTPEIVERINAYLRGDVTLDEYLDELRMLAPREPTSQSLACQEKVRANCRPRTAALFGHQQMVYGHMARHILA